MIGWPEGGTPPCATYPHPRVYTGKDPCHIQSLTLTTQGERSNLAQSLPFLVHTFRTLRRERGSHPRVSSLLSLVDLHRCTDRMLMTDPWCRTDGGIPGMREGGPWESTVYTPYHTRVVYREVHPPPSTHGGRHHGGYYTPFTHGGRHHGGYYTPFTHGGRHPGGYKPLLHTRKEAPWWV